MCGGRGPILSIARAVGYAMPISINARQQLSLCEVSSPSRFGCEELRPQLRMIMVDGWRRELRACSPVETTRRYSVRA